MNSKASITADMSPIKCTVTDLNQICEIETTTRGSSLDRLRAYVHATSHVFGTKVENCSDNT